MTVEAIVQLVVQVGLCGALVVFFVWKQSQREDRIVKALVDSEDRSSKERKEEDAWVRSVLMTQLDQCRSAMANTASALDNNTEVLIDLKELIVKVRAA